MKPSKRIGWKTSLSFWKGNFSGENSPLNFRSVFIGREGLPKPRWHPIHHGSNHFLARIIPSAAPPPNVKSTSVIRATAALLESDANCKPLINKGGSLFAIGSGFNPSQKIFCQNPIHLSHMSKYINHKKKHLWKCTQIFGTFSLQISETKPVAFQCFAMFLSAPRHDSYIFAWKRFIFSSGIVGNDPRLRRGSKKPRHRFCWSKMAAVFGVKSDSSVATESQTTCAKNHTESSYLMLGGSSQLVSG